MKALAFFGFLILAAQDLRAQHSLSYRPGFDVIHYDLALDLPDDGRVIRGRATLDIARTAKSDMLVLDLVGMRVDSVVVRAQSGKFTQDSAGIRIPMPAFVRADTLRVMIAYSGEPTDGLIIRTDSLGRWTAFGDNWPTRARHWIPSIDDPSDKATVTWSVTAPPVRRVVANGHLLEENPQAWRASDGSLRARTVWHESRPIPTYLMVIGAAPLAYYDLGLSACGRTEVGGCLRQSIYFAPEQRPMVPGPFVKADEIVSFFSDLVAPFPYEKLAHVQSSTKFGGMENASAIFYSDKQFREGTMRAGLIAHEVAHQWFGNSVTPHRWADLWLSEGFASYFEQVWVQRFDSDTMFRANMRRIRDEIIASPAVAKRPVVDSAERNWMNLLNENSYQKGAWALHMLRGIVGDSAFFRGVRSYYNTHRHSTAATDDLRRAIERESGDNLVWFFRQWVERPGFAELSTSWQYNSQTQRVQLTIRQSVRFGPYRFPLGIDVRTRTGVQRVIVNVPAQPDVTVTLPTRFAERPTQLIMDPDVALLATFRP